MNDPKKTEYLTTTEASVLLKRHRTVIHRAIFAGTLPHYLTATGGTKLVKMKDAMKWAKNAVRGRPTENN